MADVLVERGADWSLTVKGNRPTLLAELQALSRLEWRSLSVVTVTRGISFPHAAQAIQLIHRTRRRGATSWHGEVVSAITALPAEGVQGPSR